MTNHSIARNNVVFGLPVQLAAWSACLILAVSLSGCGILKRPFSRHHEKAETGMDLYLLIGQSNMAGRSAIGPAQEDTLNHVYLFTGNGWERAANPLNKYSTVRYSLSMQKLGPGYSFAKKLAECTGKKIGLIVNARGGTNIASWQKGYTGAHDVDLYEKTLSQIKKAEKYGKLKAIIWHQGENDQYAAASYMPLLKRLVASLRKDLHQNVFFLAGELGWWMDKHDAMNKVIGQIPSQIKNTGFVRAEGLAPIKGDTANPHFDTQSQLILGTRYADAILKKIYRSDCSQGR